MKQFHFEIETGCSINATTKNITISLIKSYYFIIYLMGCVNTAAEKVTQTGPSKLLSTSNKHKSTTLRVATLNFSGIMRSPFEFYSGQFLSILKSISSTFQELTPQYFPEAYKSANWPCAKLDKRLKETRLCPLYSSGVGTEGDRFLSEEEFKSKWRTMLNEAMNKEGASFSSDEIESALQFDLLSYHTLLRHVYGVESIDQAEELSPKVYLEEYSPLFKQSFLDMEKKVKKCQSYLRQHIPDVLFIQEASNELILMLQEEKEYQIEVGPESDAMIVFRKGVLGEKTSVESVLSQSELSGLSWQGRTAATVVGKHILLSGHLSSDKQKNAINVGLLKKSLHELRSAHPQYQIICGSDVNSYLEKWEQAIHVYPSDSTQPTTLKKRTHAQVQRKKAEVVSGQSKDAIISTLPIVEGKIHTIDGKWPDLNTFLPLDSHPFDHFLVEAELQLSTTK